MSGDMFHEEKSMAVASTHSTVVVSRPASCPVPVIQTQPHRKGLDRIHLDTLATALGFLDMFAICALFRVSKDFQRACKLALGQFNHIPSDERLMEKRIRDRILTVTHTHCRKVETIDWLVLEDASEEQLVKVLQRCTKLQRIDEFPYDDIMKLIRRVDYLPCATHIDAWIFSPEDIETIATRCTNLRSICFEWQGRASIEYTEEFRKLFANNRDIQSIVLTNFQIGGIIPELTQLEHLSDITIRPFLEDGHCKQIGQAPGLKKLNFQGNP